MEIFVNIVYDIFLKKTICFFNQHINGTQNSCHKIPSIVAYIVFILSSENMNLREIYHKKISEWKHK